MTETRATRQNRAYSLVAYDPSWSELFRDIEPQLQDIFGDNAVAVEHIGSTSVPGMVAKPQIDILVMVKDLQKVKDVYDSLTGLGFKARGDYIEKQEESFIKDDDSGHRLYSIHTMDQDNLHAKMYLVFRNYLRSHAHARDLYIGKKLELRDAFGPDDYNAYDFGKAEIIQQLKAEAIAWHEAQVNPDK